MGPGGGITVRILPTELIPISGRIFRAVDDRLTDNQINSPTETTKIDRIMDTTITKRELGKLMETFVVHHQDKDGTYRKVVLSADRNLFNLESRHLEDQTVTQALFPLLMNKNFRKVTINLQRTLSVSPPPVIALTNYQNFVR